MMVSKRRLRKDVEKAIEDRDVLLGRVNEAVEKADKAHEALNAFIEEYRQANGVREEDSDER